MLRLIKILSFILIISISAAFICSCSNLSDAKDITEWEILNEQTDSIKDVIHRNQWKQFNPHKKFQLPYKPINDFQYVWLRGTVQLNNPSKYFGINMGRILFLDKTYVNGYFIGSHFKSEVSNVHLPRNYKITDDILKSGKNQIYIYLGVYGNQFGGISDKVRLLQEEDYVNQKKWETFIYTQLPIGLVILMVWFVLFCLVFYLWNRKEIVNIYAAGITIFYASEVLMLFAPYFPFSNEFRITSFWLSLPILSIFLIMFIQSFFKVYLTNLNKIIIPSLLIIIIAILLNPNSISDLYLARILVPVSTFIMFPTTFFLLYHVNKIRPDRTVFIFLIFGVLPSGFILWDLINYLWIDHVPPILYPYFYPFFTIIVIMYVIREQIKKRIEFDLLFQKLNKSGKSPTEFKLTRTTEEKLDNAIAFINENYSHDISREGLAEAVGISPDHMSRMFLSYTGKKINHYINGLRINEAAKKLKETDTKIIDIAFSVGFESLATFNRVFVKTFGKNPSTYRKK